ncbi:MAG: hypothetical protein DME06_07270 [Candidatus Rokuibacteriota bacterium]|nr:MAG: hypothetical protein DME09_05770 [Candidatus Rokubacteria bacterium]PYN13280.1 MAG: hypothetical protein DME06_07270 [Candidatus Rokubacteria bacterium]
MTCERLPTVEPAAAPGPVDLEPSEPPVLGHIPWGYGDNRVTALARDPHWIFVYWELTDDAIARARAEVGAPDAECVLRVYDTTYRLFDGTNANWSMDVPIHRPSNNHYVCVNRPASTLHVDIGVKSREGYFAKIARSAPAEMPRDSISPDTRVEWMTVQPGEGPFPAYAHRFLGPSGAPPSGVPGAPGADLERIMHSLAGEGWTPTEWTETDMGGRTVRWVRWVGPWRREQWQAAGPGVFAQVEIVFEGERRVIRTEHGERVVLGPWRVVIYGLDPAGGRRVVDRWAIQYSWGTESGGSRIETGPIVERILQGYRTIHFGSGSEARLVRESWASEVLQMGASEWRWLGASESWLAGASETTYLGASEIWYLGASETLFVGASETLLVGASGFMGASEARGGGASEGLLLGASAHMAGGSAALPLAAPWETCP